MIKCFQCGKYCKPYDGGTLFGNPLSVEPPDEEVFCKKCSKKLERHYLKRKIVPVYWLKPNWVEKVCNKIGCIC